MQNSIEDLNPLIGDDNNGDVVATAAQPATDLDCHFRAMPNHADDERLKMLMGSQYEKLQKIQEDALQKSIVNLKAKRETRAFSSLGGLQSDDEVMIYASDEADNRKSRSISPVIINNKQKAQTAAAIAPPGQNAPCLSQINLLNSKDQSAKNMEQRRQSQSSDQQYSVFEVKCNPSLSFMYKIDPASQEVLVKQSVQTILDQKGPTTLMQQKSLHSQRMSQLTEAICKQDQPTGLVEPKLAAEDAYSQAAVSNVTLKPALSAARPFSPRDNNNVGSSAFSMETQIALIEAAIDRRQKDAIKVDQSLNDEFVQNLLQKYTGNQPESANQRQRGASKSQERQVIKAENADSKAESEVDQILKKYLKETKPEGQKVKESAKNIKATIEQIQNQDLDLKMSLNSDDFDLTHGKTQKIMLDNAQRKLKNLSSIPATNVQAPEIIMFDTSIPASTINQSNVQKSINTTTQRGLVTDERDENAQSFLLNSQHTLIDFNLTHHPGAQLDDKNDIDGTTDDDIEREQPIDLNQDEHQFSTFGLAKTNADAPKVAGTADKTMKSEFKKAAGGLDQKKMEYTQAKDTLAKVEQEAAKPAPNHQIEGTFDRDIDKMRTLIQSGELYKTGSQLTSDKKEPPCIEQDMSKLTSVVSQPIEQDEQSKLADFEHEIKSMLDKIQDQTKNFAEKGQYRSVERQRGSHDRQEEREDSVGEQLAGSDLAPQQKSLKDYLQEKQNEQQLIISRGYQFSPNNAIQPDVPIEHNQKQENLLGTKRSVVTVASNPFDRTTVKGFEQESACEKQSQQCESVNQSETQRSLRSIQIINPTPNTWKEQTFQREMDLNLYAQSSAEQNRMINIQENAESQIAKNPFLFSNQGSLQSTINNVNRQVADLAAPYSQREKNNINVIQSSPEKESRQEEAQLPSIVNSSMNMTLENQFEIGSITTQREAYFNYEEAQQAKQISPPIIPQERLSNFHEQERQRAMAEAMNCTKLNNLDGKIKNERRPKDNDDTVYKAASVLLQHETSSLLDKINNQLNQTISDHNGEVEKNDLSSSLAPSQARNSSMMSKKEEQHQRRLSIEQEYAQHLRRESEERLSESGAGAAGSAAQAVDRTQLDQSKLTTTDMAESFATAGNIGKPPRSKIAKKSLDKQSNREKKDKLDKEETKKKRKDKLNESLDAEEKRAKSKSRRSEEKEKKDPESSVILKDKQHKRQSSKMSSKDAKKSSSQKKADSSKAKKDSESKRISRKAGLSEKKDERKEKRRERRSSSRSSNSSSKLKKKMKRPSSMRKSFAEDDEKKHRKLLRQSFHNQQPSEKEKAKKSSAVDKKTKKHQSEKKEKKRGKSSKIDKHESKNKKTQVKKKKNRKKSSSSSSSPSAASSSSFGTDNNEITSSNMNRTLSSQSGGRGGDLPQRDRRKQSQYRKSSSSNEQSKSSNSSHSSQKSSSRSSSSSDDSAIPKKVQPPKLLKQNSMGSFTLKPSNGEDIEKVAGIEPHLGKTQVEMFRPGKEQLLNEQVLKAAKPKIQNFIGQKDLDRRNQGLVQQSISQQNTCKNSFVSQNSQMANQVQQKESFVSVNVNEYPMPPLISKAPMDLTDGPSIHRPQKFMLPRQDSQSRSFSYLNILRDQNEQMLEKVSGAKHSNFGYFKDQIRDIDYMSGRPANLPNIEPKYAGASQQNQPGQQFYPRQESALTSYGQQQQSIQSYQQVPPSYQSSQRPSVQQQYPGVQQRTFDQGSQLRTFDQSTQYTQASRMSSALQQDSFNIRTPERLVKGFEQKMQLPPPPQVQLPQQQQMQMQVAQSMPHQSHHLTEQHLLQLSRQPQTNQMPKRPPSHTGVAYHHQPYQQQHQPHLNSVQHQVQAAATAPSVSRFLAPPTDTLNSRIMQQPAGVGMQNHHQIQRMTTPGTGMQKDANSSGAINIKRFIGGLNR